MAKAQIPSKDRRRWLKDAPEAKAARDRVIGMIDAVPPAELVLAIKRAPSLRGMILGYVAELMFERYVPQKYKLILSEHIEHHDDHDRAANKADRSTCDASPPRQPSCLGRGEVVAVGVSS